MPHDLGVCRGVPGAAFVDDEELPMSGAAQSFAEFSSGSVPRPCPIPENETSAVSLSPSKATILEASLSVTTVVTKAVPRTASIADFASAGRRLGPATRNVPDSGQAANTLSALLHGRPCASATAL